MDWSKPQDVNDLDIAFGGRAAALMPLMAEIPKCYNAFPPKRPSVKFAQAWFYKGIDKPKFTPRDGIDTTKALRHIKACLGSFELKHEHKMAGVAFLLDQFFEQVVTPKETYIFSVEAS
jgi:hypothetical protein